MYQTSWLHTLFSFVFSCNPQCAVNRRCLEERHCTWRWEAVGPPEAGAYQAERRRHSAVVLQPDSHCEHVLTAAAPLQFVWIVSPSPFLPSPSSFHSLFSVLVPFILFHFISFLILFIPFLIPIPSLLPSFTFLPALILSQLSFLWFSHMVTYEMSQYLI
jgi:hypothetical protein